MSCLINSLNNLLRLFAPGGVAAPRHSPAMTRRRALPDTKIRSKLFNELIRQDTSESAFEALKRAPGPGGDGTPIEDGQVTELFVGPTKHLISEETLTIYNVALEGHDLYPGTVTRQVIEEDGWVMIQTTKRGGLTPLGVLSGIPAKSLWRDVDLRIQRIMYHEMLEKQ